VPPERREPGPDEADAALARRMLLRIVPVALALFLGSIALGFLPRLLAERSPALARLAAIGVWLVLPLFALAMGASVLRRLARLRGRDATGPGAGSGRGERPGARGCDGDPPHA
jgi:hypothetical protein